MYKITNTKTGKWTYHDEKSLVNAFECDSWIAEHYMRDDYNNFLDECDEEEKEYFESQNFTIYDDREEYLKDMVEYETWCSPRGVESLYKLEKESEE